MVDDKPPRGEQEFWRANTYALLAKLLGKPPNRELLMMLSTIPPHSDSANADAVAAAWTQLGEVARLLDESDVADEFNGLFQQELGSLVPHASWYLAGQLNAKPLHLLRVELSGLGIAADGELCEDHAAMLCDIMQQLIEIEDPRQIGFFTRHLKPWLPGFFQDLHQNPAARFYRPVGLLGEAFIEVERIFLRDTY